MSILLPVRFTSGQRGLYSPPYVAPPAVCVPGLAWELVPNLNPRSTAANFTGAYTTMPNGKVLVIYREIISAGSEANVAEFDPVTVTYSAPTLAQISPPPARQDYTGKLVALSDGTILAVINAQGDFLGYSYTYDRSSDSWSAATRTVTDFADFGLVAINGGDTVLKFGGRQRNDGLFYGTVDAYDTATRTWSTLTTPIPIGLRHVVAVTLSDGRVLVGGGDTYSVTKNYRYWFYEPSTQVFTEANSVSPPLYLHSIVDVCQLGNGLVFMCGDRVDKAVLFDPDGEYWSQFLIDSPIRDDFALSKLPDDERLLITGPTCHILTMCEGPEPTTCGLPLSRFSGTYAKTKTMSQHSHCMNWSDDGKHLYVGLLIHTQCRNYVSAGNGWEIDEQVYVGLMRPPAPNAEDTDGVWVKPDGTELWINHHSGLGLGKTSSYILPDPYSWTETGPAAPVLITTIATNRAEFKHLNDLNINPAGTKIISFGNDANQFPYQLDLSAWDLSTAAYGTDNKIITASNCFVPSSGQCLYRSSGKFIYKYIMTSPWELTSLSSSLVDSINLTAYMTANIMAIYVTDTRLFVIDDNDILYQFNSHA